MAIILKRNLVSGNIPTTASIALGELAVNTADGKLFLKKSSSLGETVEEVVTTNTTTNGNVNLLGNLLIIGRSSFSGSVNYSGSLIPYVQSGKTSDFSVGSPDAAWSDVYVSRSLSFVDDTGVITEVFGGDEYIQLGNVRLTTSSVTIYNQSNEVQTKISSEAPDFFIIKSGSFVAAQINSEGVMVLGKFDTPPTAVTGGMYYGSDGNFYLGVE
jgi:hypothetical protein